MPALTPIPTPPSLRWRELRLRLLPVIVFGCGVAACILLWTRYVLPPAFLAQAELIQANVTSTKPGILTQVEADLFRPVHAGDPVGMVITTDPRILESSLAVIRAEVELLQIGLGPILNQERNELTYERFRLDLLTERVQLAAARMRQRYAEAEFGRVSDLFHTQTNIVSERAFDVALRDKEITRVEVEEKAKIVAELDQGLQHLSLLDPTNAVARGNNTLRAAIGVQEEKLRLTEAELRPITLRAPIDGMVSMVYHRSGESIVPGEPLLTITATNVSRAIGFLRQPLTIEPKIGMNVRVRSRASHRTSGTAQVIEVDSHLEPIPPVFLPPTNLRVTELGLRVAVRLPPGLRARPGELVEVSFP